MADQKDEVKAKLDIVEVVGEYVRLTHAGGYYKARCPFHQEKTPSFTVNPSRQIWHCFGCNEGGDVFSFVMRQEGLSFVEALKVLAHKAGVVLTYQDPKETSQKNRLLEIVELAAGFYHQALIRSTQGEVAREYLKKRDVDQYTIDEMLLGYALPDPDRLASFLIGRKYTAPEIVQAGLAIKKEQGYGLLDRFRSRVMIPIKNVHGQYVGFTGRILDDHAQTAKYINSPQGELYDKGRVVFGLDTAKTHIRTADLAVLVEGNMDMISSHQAGVKNVVATSGTALTPEQLKLIKRFSQNLVFSFDEDSAGQQATMRGIEIALREGMNVKVLTLPKDADGTPRYKDPDECIKADVEAWKAAITEAVPFVAHAIRLYLGDTTQVDAFEQKKRIRKVLEVITWLPDPIERTIWIKELAHKVGMAEEVLGRVMGEIARMPSESRYDSKKKEDQRVPLPTKKPPLVLQKEEQLLALLAKYPAQRPEVPPERYAHIWCDEGHRMLYGYLQGVYNTKDIALESPQEEGKQDNTEEITQKIGVLELVAAREFPTLEEKDVARTVADLRDTLKRDYIIRRTAELEQGMKEAERAGDMEAQQRFVEEFKNLYTT